MDVGLGHRNNLHTVGRSQLLVRGYIAAGIDHHGFALGLAADEVARLGQVLVINTLKKHDLPSDSPFRYPWGYRSGINSNTEGGICTSA